MAKLIFLTGLELEVFSLVTPCSMRKVYIVTPPSSWWRWRQKNPPKCLNLATTLHGVTAQKTSTWIFTAVKTSYLWYVTGRLQVKYLNVLPWRTVMCVLPVLMCKHCGNILTDSIFVLLFVTIEIRIKEIDTPYFAKKQLWSNGQWVVAFFIHLSGRFNQWNLHRSLTEFWINDTLYPPILPVQNLNCRTRF